MSEKNLICGEYVHDSARKFNFQMVVHGLNIFAYRIKIKRPLVNIESTNSSLKDPKAKVTANDMFFWKNGCHEDN